MQFPQDSIQTVFLKHLGESGDREGASPYDWANSPFLDVRTGRLPSQKLP